MFHPRTRSRTRTRALGAAALVIAAAAASVVGLSAPALASAGPTTISLRSTSLGRILVAPNGHTLYAFTRDSRNHDRCASISECTSVWPIMAAHGALRAGHGVKASLLGTITVHGVRQVTYAGHPLYTYTDDSGPASTDYVGVSQFGGSWPAVSGAGRLIK